MDRSTLYELIHHDEVTGKLFWKPRNEVWFKTKESCKRWNTKHAGKECFNTLNKVSGYKYGRVLDNRYYTHRLVWFMVKGYWPQNIDHIDGNKLNNVLVNLRDVSKQENSKNQKLRVTNTSGTQGVTWHKSTKKWRSYIKAEGKCITLGSFDDFNMAAQSRKLAEIKYDFHSNHGRS